MTIDEIRALIQGHNEVLYGYSYTPVKFFQDGLYEKFLKDHGGSDS